MDDTMDIKRILYIMQMNISTAYSCHNEYISTEDPCCCNECPFKDPEALWLFGTDCILRTGDFPEMVMHRLLDSSALNAIIPVKGGDDSDET